jgi:hypothetical protein
MDHPPTPADLGQLSDDQLADLGHAVQMEQARRARLRIQPSFGEDIRQSLTTDAQRRQINAKGPFHCSCPDRVFDDIEKFMEHCRVLHKDGR